MYLVLVRHGQSQWNLEGKFTGLKDIPLTSFGMLEAKKAAEVLKDYNFHKAYTSNLSRAKDTLDIMLFDMGKKPQIENSAALNERHYGDYQGLSKKEIESKVSPEAYLELRRGFKFKPPNGESLEDTFNRVIPYFKANILKDLQSNKNILIVSHGNTLRAITMFLEKLEPEQVVNVEINNAIPIIYDLDSELNILNKKILEIK